MTGPLVRRLAVAILGLALLVSLPAAVAATVDGGCTAEGHSTSSSVDITTASVWRVRSNDVAGGSGTSPVEMREASVAAYGLGIPIPIAWGRDEDGATSGSVEGVSIAPFAALGSIFVVAGSANGEGMCSGHITVIIEDVNPLLTLLGGGGLVLFVLGLIIVFIAARSEGGCLMQLLGAAFGLIGGAGLGLSLEQFGVLDPTIPIGLGIALLLAVIGFVLTGRLRPRESAL